MALMASWTEPETAVPGPPPAVPPALPPVVPPAPKPLVVPVPKPAVPPGVPETPPPRFDPAVDGAPVNPAATAPAQEQILTLPQCLELAAQRQPALAIQQASLAAAGSSGRGSDQTRRVSWHGKFTRQGSSPMPQADRRSMAWLTRYFPIGGVALVTTVGLIGWQFLGGRGEVLKPDGGPVVTVMDFGRRFPLDPLPTGWRHRKFWTRSPMTMAFAVKEGVPSLRFETHDSASMLFRAVDIDLAAYPMLAWRWFIELPINSRSTSARAKATITRRGSFCGSSPTAARNARWKSSGAIG